MTTTTDPEVTMTVEELIDGVEKCIQIRMHNLVRELRNDSKVQSLQQKGPLALEAIGKHLQKRFPNGVFPRDQKGLHDFFLGWVLVLLNIIKNHSLPESPFKGVAFKDQDMRKWVEYCFENATKKS